VCTLSLVKRRRPSSSSICVRAAPVPLTNRYVRPEMMKPRLMGWRPLCRMAEVGMAKNQPLFDPA
jgi:hypothetical protein